MGSRAKLFLVVRMVASAIMMGLLVSRVDVGSLLPSREASTVRWVAFGLALSLASMVLSSLRWKRVLAVLGRPAQLPTLLSHTLAGQFVSNFLPSSVGGDVLRASRLSRGGETRSTSFASVVIERLSGFVALPLITLVALAASPGLRRLGVASNLALSMSLVTLVGLVVILMAASNGWLGARLKSDSRWLGPISALQLGIGRIRSRPGVAFSVLVTAVAYQMAIVAASWAGANALGITVGWWAVMAFVPVAALAQVLPLSLNGIGLREGAFVLLLAPLGVATGQAVAFGLLLYGMNLVVSLLGAPAFAIGARPERAVPVAV